MQSQHRPVDRGRPSRLSSGGERQPADAPCRYQELFRNGAIQRGRAGGDRRQGARPDRGSYPYGFPCGRLDRSAAFLSGCPSLPENQHDRHGREPDRARRQDRTERRSYISSRALSAAVFADAARSHWAIENNLHWTLDVTFNEDQSRLRIGHGAKNMAVIRHFALNLVRQAADKQSIKRRRKRASWDPKYLLEILGPRLLT